jgi:hypothetical protein
MEYEMNDKVQVIGFEGRISSNPVSWGSAAIQDGEQVVNACSGFRCSLKRWQDYVKDGSATALDHPIEVEREWAEGTGARLLGWQHYCLPEVMGRSASYILAQDRYMSYLYENREQMLLDVADYKREMMRSLQEFLDCGLTLSGHDLELNVLQTAKKLLEGDEKDAELTKDLGKAILRSPEDEKRFEQIFGGLK